MAVGARALGSEPIPVSLVRSALGESPRWDPQTSTLWWVDISGRVLHAFREGTVVFSWDLDTPTGAVILASGDDLVLAASDGFHLVNATLGSSHLIAELESSDPLRRMNDAGIDPSGRIYAGTMRWDAGVGADDGILYRLDPNGGLTPILNGLGCPNGIAWVRPNLLAFIDSLRERVDFWSVDEASGSLIEVVQQLDVSAFEGIPDGMAVDSEGRLWIAFWGGGAVRAFDSDGSIYATIKLDTPLVSSVCFGGEALSTLFITSAMNAEDSRSVGTAGLLFACRPGAVGRPPFRWSG